MKEEHRTGILNLPKPTDLPKHLADGLGEELKTWLRAVYGPAYIANLLINVKPAQSRWLFSDKEAAKIRYWWNGSVSTSRLHSGHIYSRKESGYG